MSTCKTGVVRFMSNQWVYLATIVRGLPQIDQIRMAKDALAESISKIQQQEGGVRLELLTISKKVRGMDRNTMKNAVLAQVKRSRHLRQQLAMLNSKRLALEQHLDTLDTSELNQQVIASMRHTSSALKAMGLDQAQTQADGLLMDMEESMQDMHNITKTLSTPVHDDLDIDYSTLESELSLLLMENEEEVTCMAIVTVNAMDTADKAHVKRDEPHRQSVVVEPSFNAAAEATEQMA